MKKLIAIAVCLSAGFANAELLGCRSLDDGTAVYEASTVEGNLEMTLKLAELTFEVAAGSLASSSNLSEADQLALSTLFEGTGLEAFKIGDKLIIAPGTEFSFVPASGAGPYTTTLSTSAYDGLVKATIDAIADSDGSGKNCN